MPAAGGDFWTFPFAPTLDGPQEFRSRVTDNDSIVDDTDNPLGGVGAGNGNFDTGTVYNVDRSPPTVTNILRADSNPTSTDNVHFTVNFSEEVIGVDISDFVLSITGSISGAMITEFSGFGTTYSLNILTGQALVNS